MNFQNSNNQALALKLLDWHSGQYSGAYALGSHLLAWSSNRNTSGGQFIPQREVVDRALKELKAIEGHECQAECDALVAEVKRRFGGIPAFDEFTLGYVECALWSSTDGTTGDIPLNERCTIADLAPETVEKIKTDCDQFRAGNAADLGTFLRGLNRPAGYAGHDFWLTRNHHGAGFWDRECPDETVAERLTEAAEKFGSCDLYVGDEGKLYLE